MTAREEPRRGLARLAADPWRKLAALVLAIGLWFFLDDRVTEEQTLRFGLRVRDPESQEARFDTESGHLLSVLIPSQEYTLTAFLDPITELPIQDVVIHMQGAKRLMQRLRSNERFWVDPAQIDPDNPVFEFDLRDVQPRDEDFLPLLDRMVPERVRVELERNTTVSVRLAPEMVAFTFDRQIQEGRLEVQAARFKPETVLLRGRLSYMQSYERAVEQARETGTPLTLFRVDVRALPSSAREIREPLRLAPDLMAKDVDVVPSNVEVTIPVRPDYRDFELMVPVVLVSAGSGLDPGRFEPVDKKQKVMLSAAGQLAQELAVKTPDGLQAWAAENAVVLAPLPKSAETGQGAITAGKFTFVKDVQYRQGVDFRVPQLPISVSPKEDPEDS